MHGLMKGVLITRIIYIFTDVILVGLSGSTLLLNAKKIFYIQKIEVAINLLSL